MSALDTVARVARLRERAARARFAAASASAIAARDEAARSADLLAAVQAPATAADATDLSAWYSAAQLRAGAVTEAGRTAQQADEGRAAALADWQDLSRRREALDEVLTRWKATRRAEADKASQRLMDDLARRREEWT